MYFGDHLVEVVLELVYSLLLGGGDEDAGYFLLPHPFVLHLFQTEVLLSPSCPRPPSVPRSRDGRCPPRAAGYQPRAPRQGCF